MKTPKYFLLTVCIVGGLLIGLNAGKLDCWQNAVLFVLGVCMCGLSLKRLGQNKK